MTCKDIIEQYLKDNGYDGLVHLDTECGCTLSEMPICDGFGKDCEPAYMHCDIHGDWVMKPYAEGDH